MNEIIPWSLILVPSGIALYLIAETVVFDRWLAAEMAFRAALRAMPPPGRRASRRPYPAATRTTTGGDVLYLRWPEPEPADRQNIRSE